MDMFVHVSTVIYLISYMRLSNSISSFGSKITLISPGLSRHYTPDASGTPVDTGRHRCSPLCSGNVQHLEISWQGTTTPNHSTVSHSLLIHGIASEIFAANMGKTSVHFQGSQPISWDWGAAISGHLSCVQLLIQSGGGSSACGSFRS